MSDTEGAFRKETRDYMCVNQHCPAHGEIVKVNGEREVVWEGAGDWIPNDHEDVFCAVCQREMEC